ncbi:pyridoxamine 5'-phosphate oxidase family protein [Mycobacterium sp. CPCC 205372]|uniref:Pyridoxamine 5'-phosphate oxidase family protein n=1 Tax=Mycobacterium hippophais TaxID=3016340 RepID=A0ABT4Q051_9MYCO|nr:pyridoxamine 5'-phosphate oxidase family protein [Mycobacterium hippophais]MCZ8382217.1 pyridoxamine 5'-phosphate oxidase family protein [Mycobacterium hippophais]
MSVKVDIAELSGALADYSYAYLVTVGDDYRAHTVAVEPSLAGGVLSITGVGRRTGDNATRHSDVTLAYPPRDAGGYTLIVDGKADVSGDTLTITPNGAVLHRRRAADSPATATGCGDDCVPLSGE